MIFCGRFVILENVLLLCYAPRLLHTKFSSICTKHGTGPSGSEVVVRQSGEKRNDIGTKVRNLGISAVCGTHTSVHILVGTKFSTVVDLPRYYSCSTGCSTAVCTHWLY
jgi:hypothetical protein